MRRSWRFAGLYGLVSLSLLTFIPSAEAFGRRRHHQQCCVPVCVPVSCCQSCGGQVDASMAATTYCLYCDGTYWQKADPGQTCVVMSASKVGTYCINRASMKKGTPESPRLLHGYGFWYDWRIGLWAWYSDEYSTEYCDVSYTWHTGHLVQAIPRGQCANGGWYWDIYVSD